MSTILWITLPVTAMPGFVAHYLDDSAQGLDGFRESLSAWDLDRDGDMDFFSGQGLGGKEYWFENRGSGIFAPHLVADSNTADVGAALADVNGDSAMDRLAGGYLYLNTGDPKAGPFQILSTGAPIFTHDLLSGDIDRDGRPDFVIIDYPAIQWHRNPGPPYRDWPAISVYADPTRNQHGGIALGDFDSDGDLDVSRIDRWFENLDSGRSWLERPGPQFGVSGSYGLSAKSMVRDLDGDGDADLLQSECDVNNGRVAWFENQDSGSFWVTHLIKDSTDTQDYHSLVLADFDGDGDDDVFACAGPTYSTLKKWFIWENLDGRAGSFQEHVIWEGADIRSGHEAVAMDVDGDGDLDILTKQFSGYHTWLENLRISLPVRKRNPVIRKNPDFRNLGTILYPVLKNGRKASDSRGRIFINRLPK